MKFQDYCVLVAAIVTAYSGIFSQPVMGETALLENCGDQSCQVILAQLRVRSPEKVRQYETECQKNSLGLSVFANEGESKKVLFACWEDKEADGSRSGYSLGILPFPGEEGTFGSEWKCSEPECQQVLAQLQKRYAVQLKQYQWECATHSGDLYLNISQQSPKKVEIECGFFAYNLWDTNGDGVADSDRGTTVGMTLGSFPYADQAPENGNERLKPCRNR
jgi:hypothetical protein